MTLNPMTFTAMPERTLSVHVASSVWYQREHPLPDPIGLHDYKGADPKEIARLMARRASDDRLPRARTSLRWPKSFDATAYRMLSSVDTIDELAYRILIAPAAVGAARLSRSVVAHRIEHVDGVWRSAGVRSGWRERKTELEATFEADASLWLAITDVKSYYPSLKVETIVNALNSLRVSSAGVDAAIQVLWNFDALPGATRGVPIGPEASAVLGTIGLVSVDRRLATGKFVRLVDDVWCVAASEPEAIATVEMIREQLALHALADNPEKLKILDAEAALAELSDPDIDYVAGHGRDVSVTEALMLIDSGYSEKKLSRLRFGFGVLQKRRSPAGIGRIIAHMDLADADPHMVGRYVRWGVPLSSEADRDVFVQHVCTDTTEHGVGGRIRLAHALAGTTLSHTHSETLMEKALVMSSRKMQPLRVHALVAACRGENPHKRINKAVELAEVVDHLDLRRAVAAMTEKQDRTRRRASLTYLCRLDPELRPFVAPTLAKL